jgi:glycosyltransferase involved in cell wall biosynthesis
VTAPRVLYVATVELSLRYLLFEQMLALRDAGFEVAAMSAPGEWTPTLEAEGIRHVAWPSAVRAWNPRADARAFRELRAAVGGFDVVHTHTPKPGVMGRVAARRAGVPVVVNTVHGYYATPEDPLPRRAAVMGIERLAARCSDLEIFQSREDLAWATRTGVVPAHKARFLGSGIDLERFDRAAVTADRLAALRAELGLAEGARVVTMIGRLTAPKGVRELIAAARAVRRERPDVRFVVVGGSDVGKEGAIGPEEQAAAAADVVFAGWREDVETVLALSDVFVLPSWGPEGWPRVAMEAAAMGVPLVLTDIRGCREVARADREALLVPPRDAPALTRAIERLLDDDDLRARLGAAAAARGREFDQRRVFAALIAEYERLLRRPRPS